MDRNTDTKPDNFTDRNMDRNMDSVSMIPNGIIPNGNTGNQHPCKVNEGKTKCKLQNVI